MFVIFSMLLLSSCTIKDTVQNDNSSKELNKKQTNVIEPQSIINLPEYPVLLEKFDVKAYQSIIETDNPNTRIIFFTDELGMKKYKCIFMKHDERLRIIQLQTGNVLYDGLINTTK